MFQKKARRDYAENFCVSLFLSFEQSQRLKERNLALLRKGKESGTEKKKNAEKGETQPLVPHRRCIVVAGELSLEAC